MGFQAKFGLALLQIMTKLPSVQVYGRKKTATAVEHCKRGKGLIKANGKPLDLVTPETLRYKLQEPIPLLGKARFEGVDIRIRVNGGGRVSQIYAIRQALAKKEIKDILQSYDKSLLVADPRRKETKKFGGPGPEQDTRNPTVKISRCGEFLLCVFHARIIK